MAEPILQIRDLTVEFSTEDGIVRAVTGVSYDLMPGEVLGIVGESGSGKSVSMLTVLGLTPMPPGRIAAGEAIYKGTDLLKMPKKQLRDLRGGEVSMIFQDPMTSLNPGVHDRRPDLRGGAHAQRRHEGGRGQGADHRAPAQRRRSRSPSDASTSIRTSSRAGCGSAR